MTNLNSVQLPFRRQFNWFLVLRSWRLRRKAKLIAVAMLVGTIVHTGERVLDEHLLRLTREAQLSGVLLSFYGRMKASGVPGYTKSDWVEGTGDLKVGEP